MDLHVKYKKYEPYIILQCDEFQSTIIRKDDYKIIVSPFVLT